MELYQRNLFELEVNVLNALNVFVSVEDAYFKILAQFRSFYFAWAAHSSTYLQSRILSDLYLIARRCGLKVFYDCFLVDFWAGYHYDVEIVKHYRKKKLYKKAKLKLRSKYFRSTLKYVKNTEHTKKDRTEKRNKEAWRIEKRFGKDKAKPYYTSGHKRWLKQLTNAKRRSHNKQRMHREDLDSFDIIEKSWRNVDPWD